MPYVSAADSRIAVQLHRRKNNGISCEKNPE